MELYGKSDLQLDYKIAYKPTFELITELFHYSNWICLVFLCRFMSSIFFFKQKTAYEIRLSLVGSEMCIRDSKNGHKTDFYKAKRRIDDMNLHKKTRRIQLE